MRKTAEDNRFGDPVRPGGDPALRAQAPVIIAIIEAGSTWTPPTAGSPDRFYGPDGPFFVFRPDDRTGQGNAVAGNDKV